MDCCQMSLSNDEFLMMFRCHMILNRCSSWTNLTTHLFINQYTLKYRAAGAPKCNPIKNFANFSRTTERYGTKFYILFNQPFGNLESFISLQYWQNYAAFSHGNLAVESSSKIFNYLRQRKHRKWEHFFELRKMLRMSFVTLHVE